LTAHHVLRICAPHRGTGDEEVGMPERVPVVERADRLSPDPVHVDA
jgi:hypothetical protein